MAITLNPEEYIAALGDLTPLVRDEMGGMQGVDILNQFAGGGGSYNIPNGGFARPVATTDPTYRSGYDYARSIAGGMPMSQVIAPGVSYSPEQPGGYTQADLNIAAGITPPPPVYKEPDDPSFFGTGIGGVTIPGGRRDKMPPLRNIFGNNTAVTGYKAPTEQTPPVQLPPQEFDIEQIRQDIADSGIDFTNLFGLPQAPDLSQFVTKDDLPNVRDFSIENLDLPDFNEFALRKDLPVYQEPDLSQFVTKQDLPSLIPDVPNGRDFSIDQFDLPDFSEFALRKDLPVYQEPDLSGFARIEDLPTFNPDELRKDIMMSLPTYEQPDLSGFAKIEDLPTFNPDELRQDILMSLPEQKMQDLSGFMTQDDINKAIAGIDIPSYQAPDLSGFVTQADINKAISGINMPTYEQPDLSAYDTRLAELEQSLAALQQPTGGRFSINQPQVRGLF
jgi:hypothetical protein